MENQTKKMKAIVQEHHIIYETDKQKEEKVKIFKGEHWILTQARRRKKISKGFIKALKHWILLNEEKGVNLK